MAVRMLHSGRKMLSKILSLERLWQFKRLCSLGMGTEFDCAIHLLAASLSRKEFPRWWLDEPGYSRAGKQKESSVGCSGSARMSEFNGKQTDECCLESVRRKMHVQEDIFRKQVRELHRLYSIQKKLMGELKKDMGQNRFSSPMKSPNANSIHCPHKMDETAAYGCAFHIHRINDDRGSQDRSASSSGEATRFLRSLDLEIRPSKGNNSITDGRLSCPNLAAPAKREVNCINEGLDEESDAELTLSIGGRWSRRQSKSCSSTKEHSSALITSDKGEDCNSNMGGSSRTSGQEIRQAALVVLNVNSTGGCTKAPRNSVSKNPLISR